MARIDFTDWSVRIGEKGPHVTVAQCLLNAWAERRKPPLDPISEDGSAGPQTHDRIVLFQREHGVDDDGTIGPIGWGELKAYRGDTDEPAPTPVEPSQVQPLMTIMVLNIGGTSDTYARLLVKAANIVLPLFCLYWRCNVKIVFGQVADFDPDRHVALILGADAGGVQGAAGWHWAAPVQAVFERLGIAISDDDADPIGWVDMSSFRPDVTFFHEVFEIIPNHMVSFLGSPLAGNDYYYMETCDPVQADYFPIRVDGQVVNIANWVGPDWFGNDGEQGRDMGSAQALVPEIVTDFRLGVYDPMGVVAGPWLIRPGGYQILVSKTNPGDVRFAFAEAGEPAEVPPHAARR